MKHQKITINKTEERPEGIEISIVDPETDLEKRLLGFLLESHLMDAKHRKNLALELPEKFRVEYVREGQFVLLTAPGTGANSYYNPGEPRAVLVIRTVGNSFEVAHAQINAPAKPAAGASAKPVSPPKG